MADDHYYWGHDELSYAIVVAVLRYFYGTSYVHDANLTPPHNCMCHKVECPTVERREKRDIDSAQRKKMSESTAQNPK